MTRVRPENWRPRGIADLEDNAWIALRETARSTCITAGAGAGKTEFLAQKAAYLLQTGNCAAPKRILAISFKRDAARNLAERVQERCEPEHSRRLDSVTFDGFTKHLLDRFGAAIPAPYVPPTNYQIVMPGRRDYNLFLEGRLAGLDAQQLERLVTRTPLPIAEADIPERRRELIAAYWRHQYQNFDTALLSFAMINRLIDYMIRSNPEVRRALHATYPHVFLDEFQDTTVAQYGLLRTAFAGSDAIFTSVGDDKQSIMGWADAMPDPFQTFIQDFNARPISLILNWRSHEDLVAIQRVIAARIDPNVVPVQARGARNVDGDVAAIWQFQNQQDECSTIARWLRSQVNDQIVAPHQVAILVRMHADQVEEELGPALEAEGLALRNLARNVGGIAIQDLLCEALTEIVLPLLRLGAAAKDADAWSEALQSLGYIHALSDSDDTGNQGLRLKLDVFAREQRAFMAASAPSAHTARIILGSALNFVGVDMLRQAFPEYGRDADFERVRAGLEALLAECADLEGSWGRALDRFDGDGQVPLMTVHKSKGLEFHTMIFFGLDNSTWWSLAPNRREELNSFFVAFTRAEQRAFFTSCAARGGAINWIDNLLGPAGVARIPGLDIAP